MGDAPTATDGPKPRRRYDSPVRRRHAAETRERIIAAGSALAHETASWSWRELTVRAVAERAGVGERTVYRHFATERHLRNAVMERLNDEAGVDYEAVDLATIGEVTTKILGSLEHFAAGPTVHEPDDPTFRAVDDRRRAALLRAVEAETPTWTSVQQAERGRGVGRALEPAVVRAPGRRVGPRPRAGDVDGALADRPRHRGHPRGPSAAGWATGRATDSATGIDNPGLTIVGTTT